MLLFGWDGEICTTNKKKGNHKDLIVNAFEEFLLKKHNMTKSQFVQVFSVERLKQLENAFYAGVKSVSN